ncbi:hypothetical protein FIBSPDRAFT_975371 [Athelia psychrophila]|uniref:Dystroglycan-type cadherin-like domain-containing protein n=1 Tax=Athelia psychrophila TaxID=1759441 RepID=A0A166FAV7_9AGAM|nr:hypothetical protein FIBSPDRAFT_975371 [Fibularhizoctonia sp. CBS 109695]
MYIPLIFILAAAASTLASSISLANPINNQLPAIARVGQLYSWSFSQSSFNSSSGSSLTYTASNLPQWLTFDSSSRSFQGTPAASDEGNPEITITAQELSSSSSTTLTLCVTAYPAPQEKLPISGQFYQGNPSLSSVFLINKTSALATSNPALRVPPGWSFSIGFDGDTFVSETDIYYDVLQADGSPLPSWITFNPDSITFNGLAPHASEMPSPSTLSFALHASDQKGYTASSVPFDLVIALHELSVLQGSLPTINVTAATPFNVTLSSPADFSGVYMDAEPIQPLNVSQLSIDTSKYDWLQYDETTMTLSGQPPSDLNGGSAPILPVILSSTFNQTLHSNMSLAVVPSYFVTSTLSPTVVDPGQTYSFDLTPDLSNASSIGQDENDISLSVGFDPSEVASYLSFDNRTAQLTGVIPSNSDLTYSHVTVTFTAYSRVTHSTSHSSLSLSITTSHASQGGEKPGHPTGLSAGARKRLVLGLGIAFGVIGGMIVIGVLLASMRRGMRIKDTALLGEEGTAGFTAKEKKYYGIGIDVEKIARDLVGGRRGRDSAHLEGDGSDSSDKSTGKMSKGEFIGKIEETARSVSDKIRNVSDKYTRMKARRNRPVIGKPIMVAQEQPAQVTPVAGLPANSGGGPSRQYAPSIISPFSEFDGSHGTSLIDSPTSSSGARSIPVRRADFASPRPGLPQRPSPATHAEDAVLQIASRAQSIRSVNSVGGASYQSESPTAPGGRPRVVPFKSSTRVPVPKLPSNQAVAGHQRSNRVVSQSAAILNDKRPLSADGMNLGMHYVNALGEESASTELNGEHVRFVVDGKGNTKTTVPPGKEFNIQVNIPREISEKCELEARLMSGEPLPSFMQFDHKGSDEGVGRAVELYGIPRADQVGGEYTIGIYVTDKSTRVAKAVVHVARA